MESSVSGSNLTFQIESDKLEEFLAFDGSSYHSVNIIGSIQNQNLHALGESDMIIITHSDFSDEAEGLANHHAEFDGMNVIVTELLPIYNEFSSK